jgi:hypothetical protein
MIFGRNQGMNRILIPVLDQDEGPSVGQISEPNSQSGVGVEHCFESMRVCACVEERLSRCAYAYCFNRVSWYYVSGTLTLEGCVPSFYLKQMLQTMLRDIDHVERLLNEVDVVSSTGLSSERSITEHE